MGEVASFYTIFRTIPLNYNKHSRKRPFEKPVLFSEQVFDLEVRISEVEPSGFTVVVLIVLMI